MQAEATKYRVYRAPGWHGEPTDPLIRETDDEREAAMMAGCRMDLKMPGNSAPYSAYAEDAEGNPVEPIESFVCDRCERLVEWGDGPIGTKDGQILECPDSVENHLVTWVCGTCADQIENDGD